jgi:hypothetical protein
METMAPDWEGDVHFHRRNNCEQESSCSEGPTEVFGTEECLTVDEVRRERDSDVLVGTGPLVTDDGMEVHDSFAPDASLTTSEILAVAASSWLSTQSSPDDIDASEFCVAAPLSGRCCLRLAPKGNAPMDGAAELAVEVAESCREDASDASVQTQLAKN